MKSTLYPIRCPHPYGEHNSGTLPDFHPLTKAQITELVSEAKEGNAKVRADILGRLEQAIEGMTCPPPFMGAVAEKLFALRDTYNQKLEEAEVASLADKVDAIIH